MAESGDVEGAWANDDIPVPEPPSTEGFVRAASAPQAAEFAPAMSASPTFEPLGTSDASSVTSSTFWTRGRRAVAGAAAVGLLAVVAISVSGGSDDSSDDASASTVADEPVDTIDPTTTSPPPTTQPDGPGEAPAAPTRIEVPPALTAISAPTEVLMLADDGLLHTLSLPSGNVRSVRLADAGGDFQFGGPDIIAAPDAAAVAVGADMVIVGREDSSVVVVEGSEFPGEGFGLVGWTLGPDDDTRFTVAAYSNAGNAIAVEVGVDGSVEPLAETSTPRVFEVIRAPDGTSYVNDAGGVYELLPDGSARRVDDGAMRGLSATSILLRTCTDVRVCGDVVVDRRTGERRPVADGIIPDDLTYAYFGLDLAPDGSAVSGVADRAGAQDRIVVDLVTGAQVSAPNNSWNNSTRWAADSSGVFELAQGRVGVEFLDRASGTVVHFGDEFGQISSLAVRMPESELGPQSAVVASTLTFGGPEPSASGLQIVALTRSGSIVDVDIDARAAEVWAPTANSVRAPVVVSLGDQIAVVSGDDDPDVLAGYLATPVGDEVLPSGLFGPGPVLAGPTAGTVWTAEPSVAGGVQQRLIDLVTVAPAQPPATISVPGGVLLGGDGAGGLVVALGGDVYVATPSALTRLTAGELLAIGPDTAYVRECDDTAACGVVRVDRVAGTRRAVAPNAVLDSALAIDAADPPLGLMGSAVAPGGEVAVVNVAQPSTDGGAVDTEWMVVEVTGPGTVLENLSGSTPLIWSDDASHVATMIGADLVVVERPPGRTFTVDGLGSLRTVAARQIGSAPS